jgi:hypothetical protein
MGGEPERDESGLPPVDIEIPDDARELDRDVQAYYRELRAHRRRRLLRRLTAPLTRHGIVIPLVAGMLAVTLFAGSMLTMIAGTPAPSTAGLRVASPLPSWSIPPVGHVDGPLPDDTVLVGKQPTRLRDLSPAVFAVVPGRCGCVAALRELAGEAAVAQVKIYFFGTDPTMKELTTLATRVGRGNVQLADDVSNVLGSTYHPAGLTAIMVHSDFTVTAVDRDLASGLDLQAEISQLGTPGLGYPPATPTAPAAGTPASSPHVSQLQ